MTTTDQPLSIDDILNQPAYGRGWIIGPVTHVDQSRRQCQVADRTGDTVTVCYRPEDEQAVLRSLKHPDECRLKALGLAEYQPGSVMTSMADIEQLFLITREEAEHLTFFSLWREMWDAVDRSDWPKLPADMAENHDEYLAREYHNDD